MVMNDTPIDPEIQIFVDGIAAAYTRHPDVMRVPHDQAWAICEAVRAPWRAGGPEMFAIEEREIALRDGSMRIRIYRPNASRGMPALLYLHGGGFTFFSIDTHDRLMREYAATTGFAVIGLDYPLSPEAKFPVALERIGGFVEHLVDVDAMGVDPARLAIGGDSAGGNLSLAAALLLRQHGRGDLIKALLLNYPGLTPDKSAEAIARFGGAGAILSADEAEFFWGNYLRTAADRRDPLANLMLADIAGLPPALFVVGNNDLLTEQSVAMAARMRAIGGSAELRVYPGAVHGFLEAMSVSSLARRAIAESAAWLLAQPALRATEPALP
jgi:acetyl esterase